jgi:hypothetical protein
MYDSIVRLAYCRVTIYSKIEAKNGEDGFCIQYVHVYKNSNLILL